MSRLKYFRSTLTVQDDHDNNSNNHDWSPVIDMKTFREACFNGNAYTCIYIYITVVLIYICIYIRYTRRTRLAVNSMESTFRLFTTR